MNLQQPSFDFHQRPFLVIWETTHACDLACLHCRADAEPNPAPNELTTQEGMKLIDQVRDLKTPILVFSGGDPLKRPDLEKLVAHSKKQGIRTGIIPAVTPLLTYGRLEALKKAGVDQVALSLDASDAEVHDAFRKTSGIFERTLEAAGWIKKLDVPLQINSLVNLHNWDHLEKLMVLVESLGVVFWEVFFLVPTGRGKELGILDAAKFEEAFQRLYAFSKKVSFLVKITEAQHYRRFVLEQELALKGKSVKDWVKEGGLLPEPFQKPKGPQGSVGFAPQGVNSGKGFLFISHQGDVCPSGFLPISCGNIRQGKLSNIYRNHPVMKELRDARLLKGRCGYCPFREVCGGSRARAYALTGDYLAEDFCCAYEPPVEDLFAGRSARRRLFESFQEREGGSCQKS